MKYPAACGGNPLFDHVFLAVLHLHSQPFSALYNFVSIRSTSPLSRVIVIGWAYCVLSVSSRSPPSFVNSNSGFRYSVSFNGRFVLTIIAVPSCARLLRAEDALSSEFQTPKGFHRGPALG